MCTLYSCRRLYKITSCAPGQYNEDKHTAVTRPVFPQAASYKPYHSQL